MSKKKKVVIIIVSVFLAIVLIASLGKGKNNKKNKSPVNTPIVTKAETPSIDDGDEIVDEYPDDTNGFVKKFEIVDVSAHCYYGDKYNSEETEITIKAPKFEEFDYEDKDFSLRVEEKTDANYGTYCLISKQFDDAYQFVTYYNGTTEELLNGSASLIGFTAWYDGKYQILDGEAISHNDIHYYIDTDGTVIMYYDENTNLDSNYYDSNGNLIYQQLFLNGSDKSTWFDANGMERSKEYIYDMVLSKYGDKEIINIFYDK